MGIKKLLFLLLPIALLTCEATIPTVPTGPGAEVSFDGLTKVDDSRVDAAWVRPGIDLSSYDQVILLGAGVKFRSVRETNRLRLSSATEFPLDEEQRADIEEVIREVFLEVLNETQRFSVVDKPGPTTLTLTGAFYDVVSFVPPERASRNTYYLSQLGGASLVIELSDSMSGQVLARALDTRGLDVLSPVESNPVTNRFELERELDDWADDILQGIEYLASTAIPAS